MTPTTDYELDETASTSPLYTIERREGQTALKTGGKILVVDDEPEIVKFLSLRLKGAGYDIITAYDGASATKAAIHEQPDLVLLDIGMPCGDGHVVAQRLIENMKSMFVPIIFLTARTDPVDRFHALQVGAVNYVTKPFTTEVLLEAVARALNSDGS